MDAHGLPPAQGGNIDNVAMVGRSRHHHTYAEYLAYERSSDQKHDFDHGEIFAMAGGSPRHNALAFRICVLLGNNVGPNCLGFQSDQRLRAIAAGRTTYPDASVVCGAIVRDADDPSGQTITNPTLRCQQKRTIAAASGRAISSSRH